MSHPEAEEAGVDADASNSSVRRNDVAGADDNPTLSYLMYLSAYRLTEDPEFAFDTDVLAQAAERVSDVPRREVDLGKPAIADSSDPFEVELRGRLRELAARTRDTRRLNKLQTALTELEASSPMTSATRAWLAAADKSVTEAFAEDLNDPSAMRADGDASTEAQARMWAQKRDELLRIMQQLDACVQHLLGVVRCASDPVARSITSNYAWLRSRSSMLGMQCLSSTRCPVCLVNPVSRFNDPCGHTLCTTCMNKSANAEECYMCREPVRYRRRLFL